MGQHEKGTAEQEGLGQTGGESGPSLAGQARPAMPSVRAPGPWGPRRLACAPWPRRGRGRAGGPACRALPREAPAEQSGGGPPSEGCVVSPRRATGTGARTWRRGEASGVLSSSARARKRVERRSLSELAQSQEGISCCHSSAGRAACQGPRRWGRLRVCACVRVCVWMDRQGRDEQSTWPRLCLLLSSFIDAILAAQVHSMLGTALLALHAIPRPKREERRGPSRRERDDM